MKILYIDESGDHSMSVIDPEYPIFVLGGVILDMQYAEETLTEKLKSFKLELFGSTDIILHTADIARVRNGFHKLLDFHFRNRFFSCLNNMMSELDYSVLACVMHKNDYLPYFDINFVDPYFYSLNVLIERFCAYLRKIDDNGLIITEKRASPTLDQRLNIAWESLKIHGTKNLQAKDINNRIIALNSKAKKDNIAGLQLADLVVSPIGRYILGKHQKKDWKIIKQKLLRDEFGGGIVRIPEK